MNLYRAIRKKIYFSRVRQYIKYKKYLDDKKYIEMQYEERFGKPLILEKPIGFNEKNNWRKLYDRNDDYTKMVDKYEVKKFIADKIGDEYTFPLLGVWNSPKSIDFSKLPNKFVLKANHAGGVIVCRNKEKLDKKKVVAELRDALKLDYFLPNREWPYKNVNRRVIAEAYMGENLIDYKCYCFNGVLKYTFVWKNHSRDDGRKPEAFFCGAYDRMWDRSEIEIDYPSLNDIIVQPKCYKELVEIVEKISKNIPFVRVDCYIINEKVYIGELTFFPWSGYMKFKVEKWNLLLGELEELPVI